MKMFRKTLTSYFNAKLEEITFNYYLALKRDKDGIHDLRVAIKRLKAFHNLIEACAVDFDAPASFKVFRRLAKSTGQLRDAQVQRELMQKINSGNKLDITSFDIYLADMEERGYQRFLRLSKRDPLKKFSGSRKAVVKSLKKTSITRAETMARGRFINLLNNIVITGRTKSYRESNLHKVRIHSKEIHYTFELLASCLGLYEERTEFPAAVKKVHSVLGKWHDCEVCLDLIERFQAETPENAADTAVKSYAEKIRKEKARLLKKYKTSMADFVEYALTV